MATSGAGDGSTDAVHTNDAGGGGEEAPSSATTATDAPWTADLRGLGLDDETFTKVDGYMREKVQPHTTQLEQSVAQLREAVPEGLQQFYNDLSEDPDTALKQLASEIYSDNPEAGEIFDVAIKYAAGNPEASAEEAVEVATQHVEQGGTADEFEVELDPDDRAALDSLIEEREDKEYAAALAQVKDDNPDHFPEDWSNDQIRTVMDPLVIAAPEELDDEAAMDWAVERYKAAYSLIHSTPGSEGAAAEAAANLSPDQIAAINSGAGAPPTISGGQNASVPGGKDYGSDLGAAVRDFGAELIAKHQQAPPTV